MRVRLFLVALGLIAVAVVGCSDDGGPTGPQQVTVGDFPNLIVQRSCEENYLADLSSVLADWQDSLNVECDSTLADPPSYGEGTDPADYLSELVPLLNAWHDSLEACVGEEILDPVPLYTDSTEVSEYLLQLSPVLEQWHTVLEEEFGEGLLTDPPVFTPDESAPVIDCPADTTVDCTSADGATVEYEISAEDDCDPNPLVSCDPPSGSLFPIGETLVSCTAVDSAGNTSECSFTVTVQDTTPPVIDCPADTTLECTSPEGNVVEFDTPAADDCDPDVVVKCVPASGSTFKLGKTVVTCTAVDSSGNTSECEFVVTVADTTPPVISCPSDTTLECTGTNGAIVVFAATATDDCDPEPSVVCDPPSGSDFPIGDTVVKCVATDASGNRAECEFTVTVIDTTPPTVHSVMASPSELWPPNHKMRDITIVADVTDLCTSVSCEITKVTSSEDVNGRGDGNTEPDWVITDDLKLKVRAERSGRGVGRVYWITIECEDEQGNMASRTVEVTVPHDRGKGNRGF